MACDGVAQTFNPQSQVQESNTKGARMLAVALAGDCESDFVPRSHFPIASAPSRATRSPLRSRRSERRSQLDRCLQHNRCRRPKAVIANTPDIR